MKIEVYSQFLEHLKSKNISNVYLIRGDNSYYAKKALDEIKSNSIGNDRSEFSYQCFDDKTINIDELVLACEMPPMMCEHKCVVAVDLQFEKISEIEVQSICALIEDIPSFVTLVFYSISNDLDLKKSKTKRICDLIQKHGVDINFTTKSSKDNAISFAVSLAKEKGCTISNANAKVLCEKAFNDFSVIAMELEKIANYKNGGEITLNDIEQLFSLYLNSTVYELARCVLSNNLELSLKKLSDMKQQKEEPIAILSALSSSFIDIYRATAAKNFSKNAESMKNDFEYRGNVTFRVDNAFRDCDKFNQNFIKSCINQMSKTDLAIKTTSSDGYWLLEQLIINIFVARERFGN